ncbi:MAG: ureidoglycolate lyase [Rhodothermia bacterium]|nr:ureidoglycolate lyase [Rhodothermia bacterium]
MSTLQAHPITSERFAPFGKVVLSPSKAPTAEGDTFKFWSDIAHFEIEGETEIGLCTVYRTEQGRVDWMERHHRTPEILVPIDSQFILPVMTNDEPPVIEAFTVNVGEAVVLRPGAWHSACIPADADRSTYFVIFRRGTPSTDVEKTSTEPTEVSVA